MKSEGLPPVRTCCLLECDLPSLGVCLRSVSRVQGAGFRVQGSGCTVHGAGFRVQGSGRRVQGAGFRAGCLSRTRRHTEQANPSVYPYTRRYVISQPPRSRRETHLDPTFHPLELHWKGFSLIVRASNALF